MNSSKTTSWPHALWGVVACVLLVGIVVAFIYGLSKVLTGTVGGAVAGGVVAIIVSLATKSFEFHKHREASIAEKKREVYRRLLTPWERILADGRSNKQGDDLFANIDFAALYASTFDAVLYGSEAVVQRYVDFRSPNADRDPIDHLRAFAALLIAMREDVTGKKATLSEEAILRTIVNFKPEELVLLRFREFVSKNPEKQRQVTEFLGEQPPVPESGPVDRKTG